jgi:general secretion pathway protein D
MVLKKKHIKHFCKILLLLFFITTLSAVSFADTQSSEQKVAFNFIDVEIPTVIKFISELTGKNFLFDEKVKGKINIVAPTKLSIDESFALFTSVLELKGFTIVPLGANVYKIIPSSFAKQAGRISEEDEFPVSEAYITRLLPLEHIKVEEAVKFLAPLISRNGHISAFGPGNLLLVVDSALNVGKLMSILKHIDTPPTYEEPPRIHVYPLEHADALELSKVLEGMIKSTQTANKKQNKTTEPFGWVSITPDKATNSLIIMASFSDYQNIVQVVKELDKRRRQVYVEAMIIEASVDQLKDLGTEWRATVTHSGEPVAIGGLGTITSVKLQEIISGLTGFSAGGLGNFFDIPLSTINTDGSVTTSNLTVPGFSVLFSLSIFEGIINVLSTPQILTSDNEEAEIVVGENVPFISSRERDITTTNTVLSSIERQDVGIRLIITPQITEGDYVKLDLYQEISSVKEESEEIITTVGPSTTKRATKTSVVVRDAQTVVIGGLMEEKDEEGTSKIPLLGDIPLLGWLFKHKGITKRKTNLLVFLTPHIVKDSTQLAEISREKHEEFSMKEKQYKEGELMIKFREYISPEGAYKIISDKGAYVIQFIDAQNTFHVRLRNGTTVPEAINEFSSLPEVLSAEPHYRIKLQKGISHSQNGVDSEYSDTDTQKLSSPLQSIIDEKQGIREMQSTFESGEELLMKFKDTISHERSKEILSQYDVSVLRYDETINVYHVKVGDSDKGEGTRQAFSTVSELQYIVPYYKIKNQDETAPVTSDLKSEPAPPAAGMEETEHEALPEFSNTVQPKTEEHEKEEELQESLSPLTEHENTPVENHSVPETDTVHEKGYFIQVGAWKNPEYADETLEKLKGDYPDAYIITVNNFNKLRIPGIKTKNQGVVIIKDIEENFNLNPLLMNSKK